MYTICHGDKPRYKAYKIVAEEFIVIKVLLSQVHWSVLTALSHHIINCVRQWCFVFTNKIPILRRGRRGRGEGTSVCSFPQLVDALKNMLCCRWPISVYISYYIWKPHPLISSTTVRLCVGQPAGTRPRHRVVHSTTRPRLQTGQQDLWPVLDWEGGNREKLQRPWLPQQTRRIGPEMSPQNTLPTPAPTQKEWGGRDGVTADHVRGKGGGSTTQQSAPVA